MRPDPKRVVGAELSVAQEKEINDLVATLPHPPRPKECYQNTRELVEAADGDLTYWEGMLSTTSEPDEDGNTVTHVEPHAWAMRDNAVVDITPHPETGATHVGRPPENRSYVGHPISSQELLETDGVVLRHDEFHRCGPSIPGR